MRHKYLGSSAGITVLIDNPASPTKGMVADITNSYTSGIKVGDIRGAWLADTVAETVTGSGELVANGTFDTDTSGWTSSSTGTCSIGWNAAGAIDLVGTGTGTAIARTTFPAAVGRSYTFSISSSTGGVDFGVGSSVGASNFATSNVAVGSTVVRTFVATSSTVHIQINGPTSAATKTADNISVKLAEPDRSVKNNGLIVNGSLVKAPVAAGSQLVSYSVFSAANYLEQPYSANLDFGTGDFCVMGWAKVVSVADTNKNIFDRSNATTGLVLSIAYSTGLPSIRLSQDSASDVISGANSVSLGRYVFLVALRRGVSVELYVDTALVASGASSKNISGNSLVTRIGIDDTLNAGSYACTNTSLALWRIGAGAPSADQIAKIYRDELPLFQPNAKCTIDGTSTAVTALDYDEDADLLHVGTSWGRSTFKDLLRVESEATMVGSVTSLSASGGAILTGGTSAKFYQPALSLREELARKDEATQALGSEPAFFDYDAIAGQVAFPLPKGFTAKAVYLAGSLKRLGSTKDYTTSSDGFAETVTFGVAPGAAAWVSIMAVRA